jgi:hypothetical protein
MWTDDQRVKGRERGPEFQLIAHQRSFLVRLEAVVVAEFPKRPTHLLVAEAPRPVVRGDAHRQPPPDAEVPRFPRDLVAGAEQAGGRAGDDALTALRRRAQVDVDAARDVEAARGRRCHERLDADHRHGASFALRRSTLIDDAEAKVRPFDPLADLLGEPDEDPLGASDVTEPIVILVLHQFTDQLGSVRAEPGERVVDVLDREHDA